MSVTRVTRSDPQLSHVSLSQYAPPHPGTEIQGGVAFDADEFGKCRVSDATFVAFKSNILSFASLIKSFHRAAEHARRLLTAFRAARRLLTDYWHSFVTRESMRGACSLAYRQSRGFGGKGAGNPDLAESWTPP